MKLKLDFVFQMKIPKIQHGEGIVLIGSCFSNEMGLQFENNGFKVNSNSFGTIFHPVPLARMIQDSLDENSENSIFQRQDLFFSWNAAGTHFGYSKAELNDHLNDVKTQFKNDLKTAKYLFITLGSAFGYVHNQSGDIVANCHKMPASTFQKCLSDLNSMTQIWNETIQKIKVWNPAIQIVFTLSPVRHIKDGLIENNRSKARLFELIESLNFQNQIAYFPAYEIVLDELRDYRFFKADGMHPNELAINYVWEKLKSTMMTAESQNICTEIQQLKQMENHISIYAESKENLDFISKTKIKIELFLERNPAVFWGNKKS